jgi:hypothetical protein
VSALGLLGPAGIVRPLRGWETVDTVIAWIAFGSAVSETEWDMIIYFGASEWVHFDPSEIPGLLERVAAGVEDLALRPCLHVLLEAEAAPVLYGTATRDMIAAAAKSKAVALSLALHVP